MNDDELAERLRFTQNAAGSGPRTVRLLPRAARREDPGAPDGTALRRTRGPSSTCCVGHPAVERVLYPQLPDHPGHAAAAKQMSDFGGMVSFTLRGGEAARRWSWRPHRALHARRVARRGREPDRTPGRDDPCLRGRFAAGGARQPRPPLASASKMPPIWSPTSGRHSTESDGRRSNALGSVVTESMLPGSIVNDQRPIVIAANRLPVMRSADGDWEPSPGGLVRALLPMLRALRRCLGSGGPATSDDDPAPFAIDGVELYPVAISPTSTTTTTRASPTTRSGRCTTTRCATRPSTRRAMGRLRRREPTIRRRGSPRSPRPTRSSGCTTTTCSSCRRCCAPCGPTPRSASSCTSRSRRSSCSPGCRGGRRSSTGCSVPTWWASSARSARATSSPSPISSTT